jgi:chromosome segregation ATPase
MNKKNLPIIIVFILLSLLWCFVPLFIAQCEAAAETMPTSNSYIKVPITQWQKLKENTNRLQANLTLLADSLTAQEKQQAELMTLLTKAKTQVQQLQQELQTASASLESAKKSLQTANEYAEKLRRQIQTEREAAADERERAYWKGWLNGFCVGLAGGVIAVATK